MPNPFRQPELIKAEPFMSMPAKFRARRRPAWSDPNRQGAEVDSFLEGGNLYFVDIPFGHIFRITPRADWELAAEYCGWPNGLKLHQDGRFFIADYRRGLMVLDPRSGTVEPILESAHSEGFKGLNDLHFASNGDCYFTASPIKARRESPIPPAACSDCAPTGRSSGLPPTYRAPTKCPLVDTKELIHLSSRGHGDQPRHRATGFGDHDFLHFGDSSEEPGEMRLRLMDVHGWIVVKAKSTIRRSVGSSWLSSSVQKCIRRWLPDVERQKGGMGGVAMGAATRAWVSRVRATRNRVASANGAATS